MSDPSPSQRVIIAASILSTTVTSFVTNPFEVIKTKQMVKPLGQPLSVTVGNLVRVHGWSAMWRGAHLGVIVSAAGNSVYFLLYERLKDRVVGEIGRLGYGVTAFGSRIVAVTLMLPVEILKIRSYVKAPPKNQESRFWAFHGLQTQVWRDVLWSTIFWQLYEEGFKLRSRFDTSDTTAHILSSSLSGVLASMITHPLDVLKTRLQLNFVHSEFPPAGLLEILKKEGPSAICVGLPIRCLRSACSLPVFILSYTSSKEYFSRILNDYEVLDVISTKGKKNCVRLLKARIARPLLDGSDLICVKTFTSPKYSIVHEALTEAQTLMAASSKHPSICKMYDCYTEQTDDHLFTFGIVMEYFERGDLEDAIQRRKYHCEYWSEAGLLALFEQLVNALEVLQQQKICHRDIKPQNIFVEGEYRVKIGDFGVSKRELCEGSSQKTLVGTPIYFSPLCAKAFLSGEIFHKGGLGVRHNMYKSDVFSLGLTFLRMATLRNIRGLNSTDQDTIDSRISKLGYSARMQLFLRTMLTIDERYRPDFLQLADYLKTVNQFRLEFPVPLQPVDDEIICEEIIDKAKKLESALCSFSSSSPNLIPKEASSSCCKKETIISESFDADFSTAGVDLIAEVCDCTSSIRTSIEVRNVKVEPGLVSFGGAEDKELGSTKQQSMPVFCQGNIVNMLRAPVSYPSALIA